MKSFIFKAQGNGSTSIPEYILRRIRNFYTALHQNTDAVPTRCSTSTSDDDSVLRWPSSYPVCNIPDHHPDLTTHIHKDIQLVRTPFARDFSLRALPRAGSSSAPTQVPANVRSTDVPPVDNSLSAPIIASFRPSHQITAGGSPNSATAGAARGNDTDRTMAYSTTETWTSARLLASTSPPGAVGHQLNADLRVSSSDGPDIPPSSPIPVLGNIPLAGLQLSSDPHATRSSHAPPGPESQPLIPAVPPPPQSVSEPDWDAAAEGEGSTRAAFRKDKDASGPPSVNPTKTIAASHDPLQLPPPPLPLSQDAEERGYQPLHSLHGKT